MFSTRNLFVYRARDARELRDVCGRGVGNPTSAVHLREVDMIVCGWGGTDRSNVRAVCFDEQVRELGVLIRDQKTADRL